jgi:uncharacterized protein (TIGR00266 family)
MVYVPQPYVPAGSTPQQPNSPTRPPQTAYAPNAYSPTPSSSVYAPAATSSSSAYGPPILTPSSSAYTSAPGGGYTSSGYSTYAPASSYSASAPSSTLPDFSQALDLPPPTVAPAAAVYSTSPKVNSQVPAYNPSYRGTGHTETVPSVYASAVGVPVNNTGGYGGSAGGYVVSGKPGVSVGALNSHIYSGGPTGGLISEGNPTNSHKIDYEIKGHEMQLVEIELDPQETVIAEAGAMMYLEDGIDFKTKFGDGSTPKEGFFKKLMNAGGRLLAGESLFITHFTNIGNTRARAAFAAPYPGNIMPMNLYDLGGSLICQKDAFLCAAKGTKISMHFNKKIGSGLLGGEGFILQKLQGDGLAFIHAGGTVIRRELRGEKLRIDTGCVVAFTEGMNFDIQFVPGLKSMFFGGEGLNFAVLQGTGTVWLQSLPFSRMADRIVQHAPSLGGRRQDEGSALTGRFGDMANGDGFGFKF